MLWGRAHELAELEGMLAAVRAGHGRALVVRGEAGIGKSALLDHAAAVAPDMRVLRGLGVETESELPFAGLHALLGREAGRVAALPAAQADALRGALGLGARRGQDRFLVGLAVLTLLADLAEDGPVLCVVDDAHWLDRSSVEALLFAARRLRAEPVAMLFAAREGHAPALATPGLAELWVGGLDDAAASEVLGERSGALPGHARTRILDQARGNPLALLELSRTPSAGGEPSGVDVSGSRSPLQRTFAERVAALPEATRALLVVAAADDTGDAAVVFAAAGRLGAGIADLEPAEARELARFVDGRLVLRHPLVRQAAYHTAPLGQRMAAHRALAATLDAEVDADRRAWHLAAVATGPDEPVAAELERTAGRAGARGGYAAVVAANERAATLSEDEPGRARRLLAAARAAVESGELARGGELATRAAGGLDDAVQRARGLGIRATVAEEDGRPGVAHGILVDAATQAARDAPERSAHLLFRAVDAAIAAGDLPAVTEAAQRAEECRVPSEARVFALARAATGFAAGPGPELADGVAALRALLAGARGANPAACGRTGPLLLSWHLLLGEDEAMLAAAEAQADDCRAHGAIGVLPWVLSGLARAQWNLGQPHDARATAAEGARLATDTGQELSAAYVASIQGDLAAIEGHGAGDTVGCSAVAGAGGGGGRGLARVLTACSLSLLDVGRGRYDAVLGRAEILASGANRMFTCASLPDLVEAAARLDRPERATEAAEWFVDWAGHTGQPWARAEAERCRALLSGDAAAADAHFSAAVDLHRRSATRPFERARTELLYGEWLRRNRGRSSARPMLRSAVDTLEGLGARPWAERARSELRATGESRAAPDSDVAPLARLTPQELQVVRLAATGLSNRDIGARLFLSPRTVGYHLSNAYPKLGVASRRELARLDVSG